MHSGMIGQIVVMDPSDYQAWMAGSRTFGSLSAAGESQFSQLGCPTCHKFESQGRGPTLIGVYGSRVTLEDGRTVIADENYIRESIMSPGAKIVSGFKNIMPVFQGLVSEEQMNELVAYIKSLSPPPAGSAGEPMLVPPGTQPQHSKE
jgi:cytochrome c oxidase subunit 2